MSKYLSYIQTPVGDLKLEANDRALTGVHFVDTRKVKNIGESNNVLEKTKRQLTEYFGGNRRTFDLPLLLNGTDFQQEVWNELSNIPFGTTITYKQLAEKLGDVKKIRAAGRANGKNSIPIIIPCHRVIGSNNKLIGYAGGIERKRWLLKHEGALLI